MTAPLQRRLGLLDAVTVGAGSMIGAGVFSAWGPATDAAGTGVLIGLVVAAAVAFCNATSSAQLAAVHPESGGTYVYARRQLGPVWGYLAGWGFVVGKTASCVAHRAHRRRLPVARTRPARRRRRRRAPWRSSTSAGLTRTVVVTKCLLAVALVALASVVIAGWSSPTTSLDAHHPDRHLAGRRPARRRVPVLRVRRLRPHRHPRRGGPRPGHHHPQGDPSRPGRRAGDLRRRRRHRCSPPFPSTPSRRATHRSASSSAASRFDWLTPIVRIGAGIAALGVLLNLIPGVSRTVLAMARRRELPSWFATIDDRRSLPLRAEAAVTAVVIVLTATLDLRGAIGFSGVTILTYYAITNAACLDPSAGSTPLAPVDRRRRPRRLPRPRRDAAPRRHHRRRRRPRRRHRHPPAGPDAVGPCPTPP